MNSIAKELVKSGINVVGRRRWEANFQRALAGTDPVNVAVGCGTVRPPGFIATDVSRHTKCWLDLTKPWQVPPGKVVRVYADNVIEHFTLPVGRVVMRLMREALAPGGRIRLVTPDVERSARVYLHDPGMTALHLQRHRDHGYLAEHPVDILRVTFAEAGHHLGYMWDLASLSTELEAAGFCDVVRCEVKESSDPAFRGLESRASPTEAATSLVVEASKAR